MDLSTITIADFKARFYRDFTYAAVPDPAIPSIPDPNFIQDQDIQNAYGEAKGLLNQALFSNNDQITTGYLLLSAHILCNNINAANGGLGATASFPVSSRSVGNVSESYAVPAEYTSNPIFASYTSTAYGLKYLAMVMPKIVGNMVGVFGGTQP